MPSKPNDNFIYREIDDEGLKSLLNQFSEKIEETVNFGSQVSKWSLDNMTGGDEKLPILLSYHSV